MADHTNTDAFNASLKLVPTQEIYQLTPDGLKVGIYDFTGRFVNFYKDRTNPTAGFEDRVTHLPFIPRESLVHQQLLRMLHQNLGNSPIEKVQLLIMNEAIKRPTHEEAIQLYKILPVIKMNYETQQPY